MRSGGWRKEIAKIEIRKLSYANCESAIRIGPVPIKIS